MELWDAYDRDFNKLNLPPLIRGDAFADGVFHLVCDVLVKHVDGSFLLMQRDYRKHYGGMWEASAAGSALQGESPLDCARRELFEETGVLPDTIEQLGMFVSNQRHSIYCIFLCTTSMSKNEVRLQDGETIAYKWVSREDLLSMPASELATTRFSDFTI